MSPHDQSLNRAFEHHQAAGRSDLAEAVCRQIVEENPLHAAAWNLLGIRLICRTGRTEIAQNCFRQAVAAAPAVASYRSNFGVILNSVGQAAAAEAEFRECWPDPNHAGTYNNLVPPFGNWQLNEAEAAPPRPSR